uniref:TPR_REGION domain-containing protein n=1 Tax=Steinernema glaseri TaxID=37863 RepID=A0A1I7Z9C8_9BILA
MANLNFDEINDVKKVLFLDVPLPEVHAEPSEEMVRKGAFYFKPPTANTFHDFCASYKKGSTFLDQIPSTWVSVTAKGVDYENYIDFTTPVAGHGQFEPECPDLDAPSPIESLDHLPPNHVRDRLNKFYKPEKVLTDALKTMAHEMERIEHVAARLHIAMRVSRLEPMNENQDGGVHWTLTTAATLYWRVKGDAVNAIKCLRHSLNNAPPDMRDVALVSMANIYQNTGFLHSAIISASAAYRISPHLIVTHVTLANIYAALADYERALKFYYSTLSIQSNFSPARARIRAIYCQTGMTYNLFPGIKH